MEGCSFCLPHRLSLSHIDSPSLTDPLFLPHWPSLPHRPPPPCSLTPTPSLTTPSSLTDPLLPHWPPSLPVTDHKECKVCQWGLTMLKSSFFLSCCFTPTEARWPIRDGDRVGRGTTEWRLDRGNRPKKTGETVDRRQNNGSVKAVSPRHCPATCALRNCCFNCCAWTVTKTMSVALLLMNNLDNSKQKRSNLLSPAPPPYSWSLLGKLEGPAPPPSSKISWSFDFAWNPGLCRLSDGHFYIALFSALDQAHCAFTAYKVVPYIQL